MKKTRARRLCAIAGVTFLILGSALVLLNLQIGLAVLGAGLAGLAGAALMGQRQLLSEAATARRGAQIRHAKEREQFAQLDSRLSNIKTETAVEASEDTGIQSSTKTHASKKFASPTQLPARTYRRAPGSSSGLPPNPASLETAQIYRINFGRPGTNLQLYVRVLDEFVYDGEYQASLTLQPHAPLDRNARPQERPNCITTDLVIPQSESNVAVRIDSGIKASDPIEGLELEIVAIRPEAPSPQRVFEDLIVVMHDTNSSKNRDIVTRVRPAREG